MLLQATIGNLYTQIDDKIDKSARQNQLDEVTDEEEATEDEEIEEAEITQKVNWSPLGLDKSPLPVNLSPAVSVRSEKAKPQVDMMETFKLEKLPSEKDDMEVFSEPEV